MYDALLLYIYGPSDALRISRRYSPPPSGDYNALLTQIVTDSLFYCPLRAASLANANSTSVFVYHFTQVLSFDPWGPRYRECKNARWGEVGGG
jgi:hypothetical protein